MSSPAVRRLRLRKPRAGTHLGDADLVMQNSLQPIRLVEQYTGRITGSSIVEFGPGDTLGAGLTFLAGGALHYASLDRFIANYSAPAAKHWYKALRRRWDDEFPDRPWPGWLNISGFPENYPDRVDFIHGAIEEARSRRTFDIVCSFQVGEHVDDIEKYAQATAAMLAPGGYAVHRIDFAPHGCWDWGYADPLTFLRLPDPLWRAMGSHRGLPNRFRHHEFMEVWECAGLNAEVVEQRVFDPARIDITKLSRRFRDMPRESLLMADAVYVCTHR